MTALGENVHVYLLTIKTFYDCYFTFYRVKYIQLSQKINTLNLKYMTI